MKSDLEGQTRKPRKPFQNGCDQNQLGGPPEY